MKIRTGFVSNSSSSSFVVSFPRKPKSIQDLKEIMFGKQEWHYVDIYGDKKCTDYSTQKIAEAIFRDIKKKTTKKQIVESIEFGYFDYYLSQELFPGHYSNWDQTMKLDYKTDKEKIRKLWKESEKINHKRATNIAEAFIKANEKKYIVVLSYGDDNGSFEAILEHTDIFQRLNNIRTSYH